MTQPEAHALAEALAPFEFALPDELVARHPPERREQARLLDVGPPIVDARIPDLVGHLGPGDLLVVNDVRVHPARLRARRDSGGAVEVLLVGGGEALVRPGRRLREGERLPCGPGFVVLESRLPDGRWRVRCEPDVDTLTEAAGEVPLPPYLGRAATDADRERYQTVYARRDPTFRAAAAPTAGLHFTPEILAALRARGVETVSVTLAVGLGTFRPLTLEQITTGRLHSEEYRVPEATWEALGRARRVVAVGTTAARVLESCSGPGPGVTDLFIRPGYAFRRVDLLLTNFHLPASSLLMLVCAFGGYDRVMAAYRHAVASGYRFYSYGDAMLLSPAP